MGGLSQALPAAELIGIGAIQVFNSVTPLQFGSVVGPYRPGQWSQPARTFITVPAPYVQTPTSQSTTSAITPTSQAPTAPGSAGVFTMSVTTSTSNPPPPNAQPKIYVFDAVLRIRHSQRAVPTRNPIQTGSNLTDHVRLDPASISLEILMTDVLAAYGPGQWVGNPSKSISCFQVLDNLRASRIPLTITTRLKTYTNMIITNVPAEDELRTKYGLRATVDLEQIFVAQVATQGVSARTQTTDATQLGTTQAAAPSNALISQNQLPSTTTGVSSPSAIQAQQGTVPGAGNWSSNNTSTLPSTDFVTA